MFSLTMIKSVGLAIVVFYIVRTVLHLKFKLFLNNYLEHLPSGDPQILESLEFKWGNVSTAHTANGFEYTPPIYDNIQTVKFRPAHNAADEFEICANENVVVRRKCLIGYTPTSFGCSKNSSCVGRSLDDHVGDVINPNTVHKCDGHGDVLNTITCKEDCAENPCFNKDDGFVVANSANTYSYMICSNGLPVVRKCNNKEEYFDLKTQHCRPAPFQCKNLIPGDSISFQHIGKFNVFCDKNESGSLTVRIKKMNKCSPII